MHTAYILFPLHGRHYNNVYGYVDQPVGDGTPQLDGHEDNFFGNKVFFFFFDYYIVSDNHLVRFLCHQVVMTGSDVGLSSTNCQSPGKMVIHDNQYFTATGKVTECSMDLLAWQKAGNDKASTIAAFPSDSTIMGWVAQLLGINSKS